MRVTAYENRPPDPATVDVPEAFLQGQLDTAVFASPSGVRHFLDVVGRERALERLRDMDIAVIGPTTAAAVEELGLPVTVRPAHSSVPDLVEALCQHHADG